MKEETKEVKVKKQIFENDFFKSKGLNETGKIQDNDLIKAIPTMEKTTKKILRESKDVPKGFEKFKASTERLFSEIDSMVKEIIDGSKSPEYCANLLKHWADFKQEFQYKINDKIKGYDNELEGPSDYDKKRIKIT